MSTGTTGTTAAGTETKTDYRQARGLALAKGKGARVRQLAGDTYLVPSASAAGATYVVDMATGTCTCPDYEERRLPCKHQWAVRYHRHELAAPDGTTVVTETLQVTKRTTYPQDWPAYTRAQCEEKDRVQILLRGLCDGIVQPKQERGRPRLPLGDAVYCATMKVYTTMSGRRATSDIRACEERGHVERAASFSSVFRYIDRADLMPLFRVLVEESAAPLRAVEKTFAVDSTGFSTSTYGRWYDHQYGEGKRVQKWVKAHAMVGTVTNVITAVEATESQVGDSPMFAPVVEKTKANGFDLKEVSADKAYLSHDNLALVEKLGGVPYVPFKKNSGIAGSAAWERMWLYFSLNKEDFLRHYHKRSNVETTFSSVKRKFGPAVRSKLLPGQLNEVLLKCLCHNLSMLVHSIHELGSEPKFWMPQDAGSTQRAGSDIGEVGTEFDLEVAS
jgi:transposase